jgi:hypothetical protein
MGQVRHRCRSRILKSFDRPRRGLLKMDVKPSNQDAAENAEVIRLAKARLGRICRLAGPVAEQVMARAAHEQQTALIAVALRVLAAIPADLAAGRVVPLGRTVHHQQGKGPQSKGPYSKRPQQRRPQGNSSNRRRRPGR